MKIIETCIFFCRKACKINIHLEDNFYYFIINREKVSG